MEEIKEQIEYIKRFAREQNLLIVSVCFKHRFCDKSINCSPLQFCKIIQKSINKIISQQTQVVNYPIVFL